MDGARITPHQFESHPATISFAGSLNNGGSVVTGYTVTSTPAGGVDSQAGTTALTHTVTGLTNGTPYTFTVVATNGAGDSAASTASNSVTPVQGSQLISFGSAPVMAVGGAGTVSATGGASGNAVTFTSTTPTICTVSGTNGSTVTALAAAGTCTIAANQAGNANYNAAPQATQTITIAQTGIALLPGWNLLGNASDQPVAVDAVFADKAIVNTVWKWDATAMGWQFFTPTLSAAALQTYATGKNYAVLSAINPGEGFWVNVSAKAKTIVPAFSGAPFYLGASQLVTGWNLMASADEKTPSQLNAGLSSSLVAANKSISTLWSWNAASSAWQFYAPTLEANGQLASYIAGKGYLPFTSALAAIDGFWVNISTTTPSTPALVGAEGVYAGTLTGAVSSAFQMLILENGEYWSMYGTQSTSVFYVRGVAQGAGVANSGSFTSANLKDFGYAPALAGTVNATYNSTAKTVSGTISSAGGSLSFSGGPIAGSLYDYNKPAALSTIAGAWSASGLGGETIAVNILSNGTFAATSSLGCHFSGAFAPRASGKNVFNVTLKFGSSPCALPGVSGSGMAIASPLANGKTQLLVAAIDGTRNYGTAVFGTR